MELFGKNVVLTGAASGIGAELLRSLCKANANVVAADLNTVDLTPEYTNTWAYQVDLSQKKEVDELFEFAREKMGHIDVFIANAGFAYYEKIQGACWQRIENIFQTNVFSPLYGALKMATLNSGREFSVVVTASAMAKVPMPGYALYASTKAALDAFAAAYRMEADDGHLLLVYPIATRTGFFDKTGSNPPIPWPTQSPERVAASIIDGIRNKRKSVVPSKTFQCMRLANRFLPGLFPIYLKWERFRFNNWLKRKNSEILGEPARNKG